MRNHASIIGVVCKTKASKQMNITPRPQHVFQEFEPPAATAGQPPAVRGGGYSPAWSPSSPTIPARRRHPTLGCEVFHTPGRARAIRACGWGGGGGGGGSRHQRGGGGTRDRGGGPGEGGLRFASDSKRLAEVRARLLGWDCEERFHAFWFHGGADGAAQFFLYHSKPCRCVAILY